MPCTVESVASAEIRAITCSVVAVAGSSTLTERKPMASQRLRFIRVYVTDAGSSPTRTVAKHGWTFVLAMISATLSAHWSSSCRATLLPSMTMARGDMSDPNVRRTVRSVKSDVPSEAEGEEPDRGQTLLRQRRKRNRPRPCTRRRLGEILGADTRTWLVAAAGSEPATFGLVQVRHRIAH